MARTTVCVLLIGIATIRVAARLVTGPDGTGEPHAVLLAALTVAATVVAVTTGLGVFAPAAGSGFALPAFLPFGTPRFDLVAALPLLVFSLTTLSAATGHGRDAHVVHVSTHHEQAHEFRRTRLRCGAPGIPASR
jgi:hypothetical protein